MNHPNLSSIAGMCVLIAIGLATRQTSCQQINIATPLTSANSSFHERLGVNFGFGFPGGQGFGPGVSFMQNSSGSAIPAFGGFDPNSGARFGFRGNGFSLGFDLSQGSTRTLSSTTPSITIPNGGTGFFGSGAASPFVTGVTPVVGDFFPPENAVTRAISSGQLRPYRPRPENSDRADSAADYGNPESSAVRGDVSVAEIKAHKAAQEQARQTSLAESIERADVAEESRDYRTARIEIRTAIRLSDDPTQKLQLRKRLKQLSGR